ncbi:MAG: hypothetical protein ACUVTL_06620 [Thermoproteota archaeon]
MRLSVFIAVIILAAQISSTNPQQTVSLTGRVTDALTKKPLEGAIIHILGVDQTKNRYDSYIFTNKTGHYGTYLNRGFYSLIVSCGYPETQGQDYVVGFLELDATQLDSSGENIVVDLQLFPGASVLLTGSIEFVELGRIPDELYFGFIDGYYGTPSLIRTIKFFDHEISNALNLEQGLIIVPSNK